MSSSDYFPGKKTAASAVLAVLATYVYFLIFAQFGFLKTVTEVAGPEARLIKPLMAVMALMGIAGSIGAAVIYADVRCRRNLVAGFAVCAAGALGAWVAQSAGGLYIVAVLVGLGTGFTTVTLASGLRRMVGINRLGSVIGIGTGLAYAFCNLPAVFSAGAPSQAVLAVAACLLGLVAVAGLTLKAPDRGPDKPDYSRGGVAVWVTLFLVLVGLDSAAFYFIQHHAPLKAATWSGEGRLVLNAGMHLVAAWLAGLALNFRWMGRTLVVGAGALLAACGLIATGRHDLADVPLLYTAGVSLYSVVLVYYPARSLRPRLAALVYGVAGWVGSGLGIGLAENLPELPRWLVAGSAGVLAAAWIARQGVLRRWTGPLGLTVLLALGAGGGASRARADDGVARGREVYRAEGCIHCHSQYVRPGTNDELWWGPAHPLPELLAEQPPLFGNRRQGPDLLNVALRRTREWNRRHLIAPRALVPGSRMPSYAHLFAAGDERGELLLEYLDSLKPAGVPERPKGNPG